MSSLRGRRPVVGAYSERIRRGRYAPAATFVVALLAAGGLLTLVPTGAVPVASGVVTPSAAIRLANVAPVHSALLVPASAMFVGYVIVG